MHRDCLRLHLFQLVSRGFGQPQAPHLDELCIFLALDIRNNGMVIHLWESQIFWFQKHLNVTMGDHLLQPHIHPTCSALQTCALVAGMQSPSRVATRNYGVSRYS